MEQEQLVLLENRNGTLPLSPTALSSVALIGPQADRVTLGDYVFLNSSNNGITPLAGFQQHLAAVNSSVQVNYAQGCALWSNDQSGFADAVAAAQKSDVAVVMVGTWSLDQTNLWTPGTNATTGEHVDLSDLALVGAQGALVRAIKATGKPTVVVFVSGKPVAEPWIQASAHTPFSSFPCV
jgi:beta-glucosidase